MVLAAPLLLSGCQHALVGNSVVLGMALCLFLGTLQLGRHVAPDSDSSRRPSTNLRR